MKITIIGHAGLVPVLAASPELVTIDDTFNFDRQVFEENPTWKWFIRYAAACELAYVVPDSNSESCLLVTSPFPGCRAKAFFTRPLGKPYDHFDVEFVEAAKPMLLQHANMSRAVGLPGVSGSQRIRVRHGHRR